MGECDILLTSTLYMYLLVSLMALWSLNKGYFGVLAMGWPCRYILINQMELYDKYVIFVILHSCLQWETGMLYNLKRILLFLMHTLPILHCTKAMALNSHNYIIPSAFPYAY